MRVEATGGRGAREEARRLLETGIHPRLLSVERREIDALAASFAARPRPAGGEDAGGLGAPAARLARHLLTVAGEEGERAAELHALHEDFARRLARAPDETARRAHALDFARALGAGRREIRRDARAFSRWFGFDAVADRKRKRVGAAERRMAFSLDRAGAMAARALDETQAPERLWRRLAVAEAAAPLLDHPGDARVRAAAFRCLSRALRALPPESREGAVDEAMLRRIHRAALEPGGDPWTGVEALTLLRAADRGSFERALALRLERPGGGDDLFARRKVVGMLCQELGRGAPLEQLIDAVHADPSPAVRQALAHGLAELPQELAAAELPRLALQDPAPEVRAAALAGAGALALPLGVDALADAWRRVFVEEIAPFVLRTALHAVDSVHEALRAEDPQAAADWAASLAPEIERLHVEGGALSVRRWAAEARERLWLRADRQARALAERLGPEIAALPEGRRRRRRALRAALREDPMRLGRVLAALSQADMGYDIEPGWPAPRITRGDRFGFRLWRALHELRTPSTDKRQAFDHTRGRIREGALSAPSPIMAELAMTKVPGEPFLIADEAGWRPYLPLPDHALSVLNTGRPVRIVTAEGVTEMTPRRGWAGRLAGEIAFTRRFARVAALRNWTEARGTAPTAYLSALADLGVDVSIRPHGEAAQDGPGARSRLDPAVGRFFPAVVPVWLIEHPLWQRFESYFLSVYQNSLGHLAVFIAAAGTWFVGRHVAAGMRMRRARRALPLVLGGWGTRGKSGTERLKAGLLSGLGYATVSKTTGCEAMFLQGHAFCDLREMFLFRPYDKATIWEQMNVAVLAARLRTDAFLWECMGLTPAYVRILQRHWMRDDISTITNTYPDHEDLQGPAGRNIPEVMTQFIPARGTLLTSEEQMRPILADAARGLGTRLRGVGWLEAGLLPSDALARFPYEEHPWNIALVLALADEIGVDRDLALREMADRVVPDLGVLKAFPPAPVRTRRLEFVNGMSANERYGALGNWSRMGFDRQDPEAEPGVRIVTVVNNRADRVPRSRVFAGILVEDVSADAHVLIGSNLQGLQGYIEEAWQAHAAGLTLWPDGSTDPREALDAAARRMRVHRTREHVRAELEIMLAAQPEGLDAAALARSDADLQALARALEGIAEGPAILDFHARMLEERAEYEALAARLERGEDHRQVDAAFAETMGVWFRRKIRVVEDFHASGDAVVDRLRQETPPGFHARIMGMQNIKGTGLDFVYRWQAWDACETACRGAVSGDSARAAEAVRFLAGFQEFGLLCEERVRDAVARLRAKPPVQGGAFLDQLDLVEGELARQMEEARTRAEAGGGSGRLAPLFDFVEGLLDAGDAVARRRAADRVYRDLAAERISQNRAALEIKKLNARQKGGWLAHALEARWDGLRRRLGGARKERKTS